MVTDLDQPQSQPGPARRGLPPRARPLLLVAAAVALVVVCSVVYWPDTGRSDISLRQEGFRPLVTVDGTTVWMLGFDEDRVVAVTNGRAGLLCHSARNAGAGYTFCRPGDVPGERGLALAAVPDGTAKARMVFPDSGDEIALAVREAPAGVPQAQGYDWAVALVDDNVDQYRGPEYVIADGRQLP